MREPSRRPRRRSVGGRGTGWTVVAIGAAVAIVASACGSGGSGSGDGSPGAGGSHSASEGSPAAPGSTPARGGTLTVVNETDVDTFDPQKTTQTFSAAVLTHVYDTLVALDYDQITLHPLLAQKWEISDDGLTVTFHLRTDVKFWSGKALDADDVVATFQRMADPKFNSTSIYYMANVKTIEAPDDHTVVFHMSQRDSLLLSNLAQPFSSVLSKDAIEKYGTSYGTTADKVDGTGPFKLSSWMPKNSITMVRNPDYSWGPEFLKNPGPAYLDKIIWREVPEPSARIQGVQTGDADVAMASLAQIPMVQSARSDTNLQFIDLPSYNIEWLGFKVAKPAQSDVRVRQAIAYAINKQALVDTNLLGQGTAAHGFLDSRMPAYLKSLDTDWYNYDPDRANKLLDEAGWTKGGDGIRTKDGKRLSLNIYAGTGSKSDLTLIQSDLKKVGVGLVQNLVDRTTLYAIRATEKPDLNYGWVAYPNPDQVLKFYFACDNRPTPNRFNFCDQGVEDAFQKAAAAKTEDEMNKAYMDAQKIIHEQVPAVPLYHGKLTMVANKRVSGITPYPLYSINLYKSTDISVG